MQPDQDVQDTALSAPEILITRFMANQRLSSGDFCNGDKSAARRTLIQARGIRPVSTDRHMGHPDREVFVAHELALLLFPRNEDCRRAFLATGWSVYAKQVDLTAIADVRKHRQ